MTYHIENTFESLPDFLDYLKTTEPAWDKRNLASEESPEAWNGNITYMQAMTLAEYGWPEGRELMSEVSADMNPENLEVIESETLTMDVAGAYPIVPLAIAGDPCHMADIQAVETPNKIVRVGVAMVHSAMVDAKTLMSHGAAVLSYIDALENAGWRCEIYGWAEFKADGNTVTAHVCLKRAQDHLDIDRTAFMLVHPSMLRRLFFRYMETFRKSQDSFRGSYGMASGNVPEGYQVFMPKIGGNALSDTDTALDYVGQHFDKALEPAA